jgi:hypothetical protein
VDNDDFEEEITLKPYPKYVYQTAKKGPKTAEKKTFLKAISGVSNYLYGLNPLKKEVIAFFLLKQVI